MRSLILALLLSLTACDGGSGGSSLPDANLNQPMCTGQLYDSCLANEGCTSGMCHLYSQSAFQVCIQTCSQSNPCPLQDGVTVMCNTKGLCKPPIANACHP